MKNLNIKLFFNRYGNSWGEIICRMDKGKKLTYSGEEIIFRMNKGR